MTSPMDPDAAVQTARSAASTGTGVGARVVVGVVTKIDQHLARISELEATIANDGAWDVGYQAGYAAKAAEPVAAPPVGAPPNRTQSEAELRIERLKERAPDKAHKERTPEDQPGEATGDRVLPLRWVAGILTGRLTDDPEADGVG